MKSWALFCCVLLTGMLTACGPQPGDGVEAIPVSTEVITGNNPLAGGVIRANGILLPVREVELSFAESGLIETVTVHVGEKVVEGQELARLVSTTTVKEDLATALQKIAQAGKEAENMRSRLYYLYLPAVITDLDSVEALELVTERLDIARGEYESCKIRSSQNKTCKEKKKRLESAQGTYNVAVRQLEYEASVLAAEAKLEKAEKDYHALKNTAGDGWAYSKEMVILTPFNGTISAIYLDQSEWASSGQPVIELQDVSGWRIETKNVSELEVGRVELGQEVQAVVNAFQGESLKGKVIEIVPEAVVQQGDVTYTLIIELEPTDLKLRPGMTVQVEIMSNSEQ